MKRGFNDRVIGDVTEAEWPYVETEALSDSDGYETDAGAEVQEE